MTQYSSQNEVALSILHSSVDTYLSNDEEETDDMNKGIVFGCEICPPTIHYFLTLDAWCEHRFEEHDIAIKCICGLDFVHHSAYHEHVYETGHEGYKDFNARLVCYPRQTILQEEVALEPHELGSCCSDSDCEHQLVNGPRTGRTKGDNKWEIEQAKKAVLRGGEQGLRRWLQAHSPNKSEIPNKYGDPIDESLMTTSFEKIALAGASLNAQSGLTQLLRTAGDATVNKHAADAVATVDAPTEEPQFFHKRLDDAWELFGKTVAQKNGFPF